MWADDRATQPLNTSHMVAHLISTSLDHLHAAVTLVVDAEVLHAHAPFTLGRAAIESAATALWLVHPPSRAERITRTLRLYVQDIDDTHSAVETPLACRHHARSKPAATACEN
jgi:hypothetical protein